MKNPSTLMRGLVHHAARLDRGLKRWRLRRFTPGGQLVLLGLTIAAVLGLDTNATMAYQGFTFLLSLLVIAALCVSFHRARFTVRRILPNMGTAGEPLTYWAVVRNDSSRMLGGLFVQDEPPKPRRPDAPTLAKRAAAIHFHPLPVVPPGTEVELRLRFVPPRRGYLDFQQMTLARPDPFNLVRSLVDIPCRDTILILPKRYAVPDAALPGSRKYHRGGVALSSSVGESQELVGLRDYRPGDPLRHIHWRSFAKLDKPIVREYEEEFFVRHALILDTFLEAMDTAVFEEAVSVAASFACTVCTQDSLLDLMFVGEDAYCFTMGRGLGRSEKMLEILACVDACRGKPFDILSRSVLRRAKLLSGCICVLLGWDRQREELIQALDALGIPRLVLVIVTSTDSTEQASGAPFPEASRFHRLEIGKIAGGLASL